MAGINIFPNGIPEKMPGINIFPSGIPEEKTSQEQNQDFGSLEYPFEVPEGKGDPALRQVAKEAWSGVKATPETIGSLISGMVLWPISKLRGTGELMRGHSEETAREVEENIALKGIEPKTTAGKQAVGMVSNFLDVITWPARKAGQSAKQLGYPKAGYLIELGGELATFKAMHGVKLKGAEILKEKASAKAMFNKKMSVLTKPQKAEVRKIASAKPGRNIVAEEKQSKQTPFEKAYEAEKDLWFRKKDRGIFEADIEARLLNKEIREAAGKKLSKDYNEAIQIYIDLKNHPEHLDKYYSMLTENQQKIVDLSQNLPKGIKNIADKVASSYEAIGEKALDAEVIRNLIDNYAARKWDLGPGKSLEAFRKFGTTTGHAKARRLGSILEGWAEGYDLKIKSATENLRQYKHEIIKTIADKQFVNELTKLKDVNGNPLLSTQKLEGYVRVEHPNMTKWEWAGQVEDGKTYGKNFFATEDGQLFERRTLYAPKNQAKNINNILGISKLANVPGIKAITKFTEITKAWILQSSLFHHQAFLRSYYLPSTFKGKYETPRQAYRSGIKAMEQSDPVLMHGVENGLTIGLKQDWDPVALRESTYLGRMLDKYNATKVAKDKITKFREAQADFLFGEFGAGLKAKAYMLEFKEQMKKTPNANPDMVAKRVANLINDDFGGLHLQRMGRNPTLQHIFRLFALAPDWTESNIRTMVKALKNKTNDQAELAMYRKFWGGVVLKTAGVTALANYALAGGDVNQMMKNYKKAWESGNLNWMKVDITPIYEGIYNMLGVKPSGRSKYFNIAGHFTDPAKFVAETGKAIKHKQSVVGGIVFEYLSGSDYTGVRRFTTMEELLQGEGTVKWGGSGAVDWDQFPSYALSQLMGTQPIQLQALMAWMAGEKEGFDAISDSLGLRITTTYEDKKRSKNKLSKLKAFK